MKNNTFEEIWSKLKKCKKVAITLHADEVFAIAKSKKGAVKMVEIALRS